MKRLVLCLLIAILLLGCQTKKNEDEATIPNPIVELGSSDEFFEIFNFAIEAPKNAEQIQYASISGEIAQIQFFYKKSEFTFRASTLYNGQELHGVYYDTSSEEEINISGYLMDVQTLEDNSTLISWKIENINYTVYSTSNLDNDLVKDVMLAIVDANFK